MSQRDRAGQIASSRPVQQFFVVMLCVDILCVIMVKVVAPFQGHFQIFWLFRNI